MMGRDLFYAVRSHMRLRFNEWVSSVALTLWGLGFILNDMLGLYPSIFSSISSLLLLGLVSTGVGISRVILLFINGGWGLSPHFRVIGAATSAILWTLMWSGFFNPMYIIPSLATIGTIVSLDLYSLWHAAEEARRSDDIRHRGKNAIT